MGYVRALWNALWYAVVFLLIALVTQLVCSLLWSWYAGQDLRAVVNGLSNGQYATLQVVCAVTSGLLTVLLFGLLKWSPFSRDYIRSRPWGVLFWTVTMTIGLILPLEWIYERMQIAMDDSVAQLFDGILRDPYGYFAVGIIAPVAEEMVFRGAVLRTLLKCFDKKMVWVAIAISALLFALVHGNKAQGVHAFIMGLILGVLYYRTGSIVPGMVLHWVNNTLAYVLYNMMPQMNDGKLIDFFHGDDRLLYMGLGCSLLILVPSVFQLIIRTKRQ